MATVAEIQRMYDEGKFLEAMAEVLTEIVEERRPDDPEIPELCAIRALCHLERGELKDAREWAKRAGDNPRALQLLAKLNAR